MAQDILVAVLCKDAFSRNWISLLFVRDWRTRVVAETSQLEDLAISRQDEIMKVDFFVVDLDSYRDQPNFLTQVTEVLHPQAGSQVLYLASSIDSRMLSTLRSERFAGLLTKDEIGSSLGWALTFAAEGKTIFTPESLQAVMEAGLTPPLPYLVLHARPIPGLTTRQAETARLAILFSIGRRDLADELKISDQWSYGMVSELYDKLGLSDLFSGQGTPYDFINEDPVIKARLEDILEELGDSKKARDLESLAFHLITMPVIEESRE